MAEENVYQIIAGERRYRASLRAGKSEIPCLVEDTPVAHSALPKVEILVEQISENWQRADLKPLELSDALAELSESLGAGPRELAKRLGKPESEISRLLSLRNIEPRLRRDIASEQPGRFTRRHLVAVAQLPPTEQPAVIARVRTGGLTAIETEREVSRVRGEIGGRPKPARRGSVRRFLIGSAVVEIRFRKREPTDAEVLEVLERASRRLREQAARSDGSGAQNGID